MLPIKTILHPTDFSERSDQAFQLACSLARDHGARLIVLHVVFPPSAAALREQVLATGSDDYCAPLLEALHKLRPPAEIPVDYRLNEGMVALFELQVTEKFHFGYAYDFTTSDLNRVSLGSHEIMINYRWKIDRIHKGLECPTYW